MEEQKVRNIRRAIPWGLQVATGQFNQVYLLSICKTNSIQFFRRANSVNTYNNESVRHDDEIASFYLRGKQYNFNVYITKQEKEK